jgi:hypothetical protein
VEQRAAQKFSDLEQQPSGPEPPALLTQIEPVPQSADDEQESPPQKRAAVAHAWHPSVVPTQTQVPLPGQNTPAELLHWFGSAPQTDDGQVIVVVVELLLLLVELLELAEVDVVALTQALPVPSDDAGAHPGLQACPAGQHLRLAPLPHGVVPAGHPHRPWFRFTHATPEAQQLVPHGVVPFGQQQDVAALVHVPPAGQHPSPHTGLPAGHVTAAPRNGRRRAAPAAAAAVAPSTLSAPRRDVRCAIAFATSSNRSLTPFLRLPRGCEHKHAPRGERVDRRYW